MGTATTETQTRVCATCLLLLLAAGAAAFAQDAPPADPSSARVAGVVVNSLTGDPVPRAHVTLSGSAAGKDRSYDATTTAEGMFSFTGLSGGDTSIEADRVGFIYLPQADRFQLQPAGHRDDVKLTLTPTGSISGAVVDPDGEPVENCSVTARSGQRTQTDLHGRFRLNSLPPGKYLIKADCTEPQGPPEIRTDGTVEVSYGGTYYPSSLDAGGAAKIDVRPGAEATGMEIRLVRIPIVRVSGKVTGLPPGAENASVTVQRQGDGARFRSRFRMNAGWGDSGAQVKKDGTFAIWRLAPGRYHISALWVSGSAPPMASAPGEFLVGDSNVEGLELRMIPIGELRATVEYESADTEPSPEPARQSWQQFLLQSVDRPEAMAGQLDAEGAFKLEGIKPGRYQVWWNGRGYVKSMRLGTAEIEGDSVDLSNGAGGVTLTLVISAQFGAIAGTVDTGGAAAGGLKVVLAPEKEESVFTPLQVIDVGADGSYSAHSVVPGDYKMVAVTKEEFDSLSDEWDEYAAVMESVTIRAGGKTMQDLKVLSKQ